MNLEHKERLLRLLDEYCDEHGCIPIGSHLMCNAECPFERGDYHCPLLDIRNQIRNEADKERDSQ